MQRLIDGLRKLVADAMHFLEIFDAGAGNTLQSAELAQQLPAFAGPETRDGFQYRFPACFGATMAMTGNRKTMRLVTDSLDEMQGG